MRVSRSLQAVARGACCVNASAGGGGADARERVSGRWETIWRSFGAQQIDLPGADPARISDGDRSDHRASTTSNAIACSAKTVPWGWAAILQAVVGSGAPAAGSRSLSR